MSKNLEKEYKEFMLADVPDLWAKIEAGLVLEQPNAKKISRFKNMCIWGAAAAVFLCLVISVPVISGSRNDFSADSSMADGNISPAENPESVDYNSAGEKSVTTAGDDTKETEAASGKNALVSNRLKKERKLYVKYEISP